jgi:hypothetical protein
MERRQAPRTSTASILTDASPQAAEDPHAVEPNQPAEAETPELSLQDPELNLDKPNEDGSNPYDTGKFNRPNAWSNSGGRKNI